MKFREHRSTREESLATEVEVDSHEAMVAHIRALQAQGYLPGGDEIEPVLEEYGDEWIVTSQVGVLGYLRG